jgi:hypothetical protein
LKLFICKAAKDRSRRQGKKNLRIATVYVDLGDRPGMSDIMADFAWRRAVESNKGVVAAIRKRIPEFFRKFEKDHAAKAKELDLDPAKAKITFDRYAGCGACPCSPGYIVRVPRKEEPHYSYREIHYDVWMATREQRKANQEKAQKRKAKKEFEKAERDKFEERLAARVEKRFG